MPEEGVRDGDEIVLVGAVTRVRTQDHDHDCFEVDDGVDGDQNNLVVPEDVLVLADKVGGVDAHSVDDDEGDEEHDGDDLHKVRTAEEILQPIAQLVKLQFQQQIGEQEEVLER